MDKLKERMDKLKIEVEETIAHSNAVSKLVEDEMKIIKIRARDNMEKLSKLL